MFSCCSSSTFQFICSNKSEAGTYWLIRHKYKLYNKTVSCRRNMKNLYMTFLAICWNMTYPSLNIYISISMRASNYRTNSARVFGVRFLFYIYYIDYVWQSHRYKVYIFTWVYRSVCINWIMCLCEHSGHLMMIFAYCFAKLCFTRYRGSMFWKQTLHFCGLLIPILLMFRHRSFLTSYTEAVIQSCFFVIL